jgi:hypothetical protein
MKNKIKYLMFVIMIMFIACSGMLVLYIPKITVILASLIAIILFIIINYESIKNKDYGYSRCIIYAIMLLMVLICIMRIIFIYDKKIEFILYLICIIMGLVIAVAKEKSKLKEFIGFSIFFLCARIMWAKLPAVICWLVLILIYLIEINYKRKKNKGE